jgi:ferritin-like metal-binding protein YciE
MVQKDIVLTWLKDAHAMEEGLVETLEKQAGHAKEFPDVQTKIQEHTEQTKQHAEKVKTCIERLGGSVSAMKSGLGNMAGALQGMTTAMTQDTLIKDALSSFSAEHFEIASYRAISEAAKLDGDNETASVCESIIKDEEAMADWLEEQLPQMVKQFLQKQESAQNG